MSRENLTRKAKYETRDARSETANQNNTHTFTHTVTTSQIIKHIARNTFLEKDIADELGISACYLSLIKTGRRILNPNNPKHVKIINKLKSL